MALRNLTRGCVVRDRDAKECLDYVGPVANMDGHEAFIDAKGEVRIIAPSELNGFRYQVLPRTV